MKYQLGVFDPLGECWHLHRTDWPEHKIVAFRTLKEAEAKAVKLSAERGGEVIVMTLHCCVKTETEYPKVEPIRHTRRIAFAFTNSLASTRPSEPVE